jgi:hypothetical protein
VLGHGEVVGRRLYAVLIRVLLDGELLGMAQQLAFELFILDLSEYCTMAS